MARRDKELADLLDRFVCVRIVQANGMDLTSLIFDFDLTSAIVFLNADRTTYGRYGSRATRKTEGDNTLEGLRRAMEGAIELHNGYPKNRKSLAGKQPGKPAYTTPEKFPTLKGKYTAQLQADRVRPSCIHCHQVGEARRVEARKAAGAWSDDLLYPYPLPEVFGVTLDPKEKARVKAVSEGSAGAKAGLRAGDDIARVDGQPVISIADVQWALHHARTGRPLALDVRRGGQEVTVKVPLAEGWRRSEDPQWRTSTWELRRVGLGGMFLEDMPAKDRQTAGLGADGMALRIKHVGQYAPHNVAQQAGFRKGDVLVSLNGSEGRLTETQLIARALQKHRPGDTLTFVVLRGGKRQTMKLTLP